jgi:hypothetical protein
MGVPLASSHADLVTSNLVVSPPGRLSPELARTGEDRYVELPGEDPQPSQRDPATARIRPRHNLLRATRPRGSRECGRKQGTERIETDRNGARTAPAERTAHLLPTGTYWNRSISTANGARSSGSAACDRVCRTGSHITLTSRMERTSCNRSVSTSVPRGACPPTGTPQSTISLTARSGWCAPTHVPARAIGLPDQRL